MSDDSVEELRRIIRGWADEPPRPPRPLTAREEYEMEKAEALAEERRDRRWT